MADTRSVDHTTGSPAIWPGGLSKQGPHRVGAFSVCPQLEGFGYEMQLRPIVAKEAPAIGNLIHVGLAYRYAMMLPREQQPSWLVYPDPLTAITICGADRPDFAHEACRVVSWYYEHYKVNTWTPVLVEHQFEVAIEGEPYTCRTDLLAVENGEYVLIDHKSMKRMKKNIGDDYRADRQMLTGLALARAHGFDVRRVVINALSREFPPRFQRFDVPISAIAYERLGSDTAYYLQQMAAVRQTYPHPWDRPRAWDSCLRKFGLCDFYRLCTEGAAPDVLTEFVVKKGH